MNATETEYAQYLELQAKAGLIRRWWFEAIQLRVGRVRKACWWKMDFLVETNDARLVIHDTKGTRRLKRGKTSPRAEDDAIVKARAIAEKFPMPVYFVWKGQHGEWESRQM